MIVNVQDDILKLNAIGLLDRLLQDKTTKGHILWATDAYSDFGEFYTPGNEIRPNRITGDNSDLIKTRARRAMEQRTERTRQHAEVFTPLWVVKKMNDFADEQWFARDAGFYKNTKEGKISFSKKRHWKMYVDARRMEITCGEAPFLVTRYDVETGEAIPVEERIGLLDRKLRVVSENTQSVEEWKIWALRAVQSIYGYELQGDNLLIARVNILCSVEEHMFHCWKQKPDRAWQEKLCNVIAWNLWQMDGLKGCVPVPPTPTEEQVSLFEPLQQYSEMNLFGEITVKDIPCRIFDWRVGKSISYSALRKKGSSLMRIDFIIGNPPYQDETVGEQKTFAPPIYHLFLDSCYEISDRVELIHPARFLFDAGNTPKEWNRKMLEDPHLKILFFEQDSGRVFPNTYITGGVAVTYHDRNASFGSVQTFTAYKELNSILLKAKPLSIEDSISSIIYNQTCFDLDSLYSEFPEYKGVLGSDGKDKRFRNNIFEKVALFTSEKKDPDDIAVIGVIGGKRVWRYFPSRFVLKDENLSKYKAVVSAANGASGTLGSDAARITTVPFIERPFEGNTQTFISIGAFDQEYVAENCVNYLKTKFARVMLGILKVTQDNKKNTWRYVPLQDFSLDSDIDWSKSISDIDQQLYAKYGLSDDEIAFIESHVKEMS